MNTKEKVLAQIREHGGFSVFLVANKTAGIIAELVKDGTITRDTTNGDYPWCAYKINEEE